MRNFFHPHIKDIVQNHLYQYWTNYTTLWCSRFSFNPASIRQNERTFESSFNIQTYPWLLYNSLKSYIGALARNTALTEKKKLRHTCPLEEDILGEVPDHFHQIELRSMILSALKELNPEEQLVLLKFYFQSKAIQEIADESGQPLPTVKSCLQRSRKKFRKILEERGFNYES